MYNSMNLPMERKKIIKKTLESFPLFILFFIIGGTLVGFSFLLPELKSWWLSAIGIALAILPIVAMYIYQTYYYKLYFYNFEDASAQIRKGVISRNTGHVRYERIQNIYVDQDILDRIFGLFDVHYETAGETSGLYSHVDGLNKENSNKLVAFLNDKLKSDDKMRVVKTPNISIVSDDVVNYGEVINRANTPVSHKIIAINMLVIVPSMLLGVLMALLNIYNTLGDSNIFYISMMLIMTLLLLTILGLYFAYAIGYKNFYFEFSDKSGLIRTKIIAQNNSYIYYDRIQNINVTQGVLERIFGLFSVTIETAAESSAKDKRGGLRIPGLSKIDAEKIKNFLLAKVDIFKNKL